MTNTLNPRQPQKKLKILLAEDNLVNRVLAQKLLQKNGHDVTLASNGLEAIALWVANHSIPFDVILMDVQMPLMDGLQATAHIRKKEKALLVKSAGRTEREQAGEFYVPIVAMTAHAMAGDRERYLAGGMDGYVSKPINPLELERVIQSVVTMRLPHIGSPNPVRDLANETNVEEIEEAEVLSAFDGDAILTRELAELFSIECPNYLNAMHTAIREGNNAALEQAAHALKGSIGSFSTQGAYETAEKLEALATSGDMAGALEFLKTLEEQLAELIQFLSQMTKATVNGRR